MSIDQQEMLDWGYLHPIEIFCETLSSRGEVALRFGKARVREEKNLLTGDAFVLDESEESEMLDGCMSALASGTLTRGGEEGEGI